MWPTQRVHAYYNNNVYDARSTSYIVHFHYIINYSAHQSTVKHQRERYTHRSAVLHHRSCCCVRSGLRRHSHTRRSQIVRRHKCTIRHVRAIIKLISLRRCEEWKTERNCAPIRWIFIMQTCRQVTSFMHYNWQFRRIKLSLSTHTHTQCTHRLIRS